jgi:hypothetical protein
MPSNCGVRKLRTKPMRCRPGSAPSSTAIPWPLHRIHLFERTFDDLSMPDVAQCECYAHDTVE